MKGQAARATLEAFRRQFPAAAELARWISLASHVDRPFLRKMRHRFIPAADAAAEADLWFSPLVESWSVRGLVLHPSVVVVLNRELIANRACAELAWGFTQKRHHRVPPIIALEERVRWLALAGAGSATKEITAELRMVTRTAIREEDRAAGIGRWAAAAFERLPERVRRLKAAGELWVAATSRLKRNMVTPPQELQFPEAARWLLPGPTTAAEGVNLERVSAGIRVMAGEAGRQNNLPISLGSSVEVRWNDRPSDRAVSILHTAHSGVLAQELSKRAAEIGHRVDIRLIEDHALSRIGPEDIVLFAVDEHQRDPRIFRSFQSVSESGVLALAILTQPAWDAWDTEFGFSINLGPRRSFELVDRYLRRFRKPPAVHRRVIAANPGTFVPVPAKVSIVSVTRQDGARWQLSPALERLESELWANVARIDPLPNQRGSPRWLPHVAYRVGQLLAMGSDVWITAPSEQLQQRREAMLEIQGEKVPARVVGVEWRAGTAVLLAPTRQLGRPLDIEQRPLQKLRLPFFTMIGPKGTYMDLPQPDFQDLKSIDDVPVCVTHTGVFPTVRLRGAPIVSSEGVVGHVLDRTDGEFFIVVNELVTEAIEAALEALRTGRRGEAPPPESRRRQARVQEIQELLGKEGTAIVGSLDRALRGKPIEVNFHREGTAKVLGVSRISGATIQDIELVSEDTASFRLLSDLAASWNLHLRMPAGLYQALAQGALGNIKPRTLTDTRVVGDEAEVTVTELVRSRCVLTVQTVAGVGDALQIAAVRVDRIEEFELLLPL